MTQVRIKCLSFSLEKVAQTFPNKFWLCDLLSASFDSSTAALTVDSVVAFFIWLIKSIFLIGRKSTWQFVRRFSDDGSSKGEWHHQPAGQSRADQTYQEVSKHRSSIYINMKKEIKLCTAIKDCLPLTLEVPFCSGCENKRMRSKVTGTARRIMSLSLSSKGDWRHPSRHCRSDLTQKNILLAKKKEKPLLSPPYRAVKTKGFEVFRHSSVVLPLQVVAISTNQATGAEKKLCLSLYSLLFLPLHTLCRRSQYTFFLPNEHLHMLIGYSTIPLAQRQLCGLHRFFSPAFTPRSPGERRCNEMGSLAWPSSEEKRGGGRKVLFIFTGDSSTAHKRCQTLNLMVFQAAAAFCAARLGSIPFTALACVLMWSMVQPKPWQPTPLPNSPLQLSPHPHTPSRRWSRASRHKKIHLQAPKRRIKRVTFIHERR